MSREYAHPGERTEFGDGGTPWSGQATELSRFTLRRALLSGDSGDVERTSERPPGGGPMY